MKALLAVLGMVIALSCSTAFAQDYAELDEDISTTTTMATKVDCQNGNLTRTVEVIYTGTPGQPPCEVHYKKITEQPGHDQVLWDAQNSRNYCEPRMREFVEMLKGIGWNCD